MPISAIPPVGFTPMQAPMVGTETIQNGTATVGGGSGVQGPSGPSFADMVTQGISRLEAVNDNVDQLAIKAATGDLSDIHDYTIAATEAQVTTQLTAAVRNKALEAFNEIMRMQV